MALGTNALATAVHAKAGANEGPVECYASVPRALTIIVAQWLLLLPFNSGAYPYS